MIQKDLIYKTERHKDFKPKLKVTKDETLGRGLYWQVGIVYMCFAMFQ